MKALERAGLVRRTVRGRTHFCRLNPQPLACGVALTSPFIAGSSTTGNITNPGYDHLVFTIWIERMEPQHHFSFRWHPHAIEAGHDYSKEPTTLVEFTLDEVDDGTRLTIVESGFEALPESRRAKAFTGVERGWEQQTHRIAKYLQTHR